MSADRFKRSASVYDSGSWNKYSYTRGDPVNGNDSTGMLVCQVGSGEYAETTNCEVISIETGTGEKDADEPASNFPQCNPGDSPLVEKKLNFITANYGAALSEANSVISGAGGSNISAGQLATVFLQWSMWDSGYNSPLWAQSVAQNNYFGLQQPSPGSAACDAEHNALRGDLHSLRLSGEHLFHAGSALAGDCGGFGHQRVLGVADGDYRQWRRGFDG